MLHFTSVRDVRQWAHVSLSGIAYVLVDLDDSIWLFEVRPDAPVCPLRAVRIAAVYA